MQPFTPVTALDRTKASYIAFCKNPLREHDVVAKEFELLRQIPEVTHLAMHDENTLMIGTSLIWLKDPDTEIEHDIGEFIIYLYRKRNGRIWDTGYYFQNINGTVAGYHHPHINVREIPGFGDLGILCIQRGQFHIYQHLRSGEMHYAARLLIDILKSYNPKGPYHPVSNWPQRKPS